MADGEGAATAYTIGWEPQPGPQTNGADNDHQYRCNERPRVRSAMPLLYEAPHRSTNPAPPPL